MVYKPFIRLGTRLGSGRLSKVTAEIKALVEKQMRTDDEMTAHQLHKFLLSRARVKN